MSSGLVGRLTGARPGETRALIWAFLYFFFVLACYYILRPVRDEMGVRSGVKFLAWLYTGTFVASLVIAPLFGFLVARLKRALFVPMVYGFLTLNILGFWYALTAGVALEVTAKSFFVWITVFSVFAVSVFWSFMADAWNSEQAKRLYPAIAAGGALGGFAGSATVASLAKAIGPANLLLIAAVLLVLAIVAAMNFNRSAESDDTPAEAAEAERRVGGTFVEGFLGILRSPYIAGIAIWVFFLSLAGTFAYNLQTDLVGKADLSSAERTQMFGSIDLAANILIPLLQFTLARWALSRLSLGIVLGFLAVVFAGGFVALFLYPVLGVLIAFQVINRTAQFAFSNPARESLWPVLDREDKYKAKNVVDNVAFRGSDVFNAWLFRTLNGPAGLSISTIALIGAPVMIVWAGLSLWLGRERGRRAAEQNV